MITSPHAQVNVSSTDALLVALKDAEAGTFLVQGVLNVPSTISLRPGQSLVGTAPGAALRFGAGADGVCLSTDNEIDNLEIATDISRKAIYNSVTVASLGQLSLKSLRISGVLRIIARDAVRAGHVEAHDIDIVAADARAFDERPKGYGVEVIPGAFTLWNQQADPTVRITADLTGISAGRPGAPVRGSGIFVAGAGDTGGILVVRRLETGTVHSDAGIAPLTPDRISGGVFVISGAVVERVHNRGPVTTYGPNDMVLDNWGTVDKWVADGKVTSYGPSGIGFVNFGSLQVLRVNAPIETFGQGARGFNVYDGSVTTAEFERVVTHGDGAVGIQISQPVGTISVRRGIETRGAQGDSLVKGVVVKLSAIALSIKPGGSARAIDIAGGLITRGAGVDPMELHGSIGALQIIDGLVAGDGFEAL